MPPLLLFIYWNGKYTSFLGWFQCEYLSTYAYSNMDARAYSRSFIYKIKILLFECDLCIDSSSFVDSGCWLILSLGNLKEAITFLRKTIWYDRIKTIYSIDDNKNATQFWFSLSHITDLFAISGFSFPFSMKVPLVFYFRNIILVKFDCKQGNRKKHIIYYILLLLTI